MFVRVAVPMRPPRRELRRATDGAEALGCSTLDKVSTRMVIVGEASWGTGSTSSRVARCGGKLLKLGALSWPATAPGIVLYNRSRGLT